MAERDEKRGDLNQLKIRQGGVIYWTHHDYNQKYLDGYLRQSGLTIEID